MGDIHVSLIIEILGRPEEHVKEALKTVVTKLGAEKGVKLITKNYHEPKAVEDSKDLFTTFAEVDIEIESLANYFGILFAYMPAHIEITQPEKITLHNSELNELGNSLMQRLHNYDAIVKTTVNERNFLLKKIEEISPELFKQLTTQPESAPQEEKKPKKKSR